MRFGAILADAARVQELLVTRRAAFEIDLAHVAGRVEMGLRVLWSPPPPGQVDDATLRPFDKLRTPPFDQAQGSQVQDTAEASAGLGRRYLQRRATEQRREDAVRAQGKALAAELNARLHPLAADVHMQVLQSERLLLSAAYLVENASLEAFRSQIEALRRTYPDLSFLASGPWPAYHFVSGQSERAYTGMP